MCAFPVDKARSALAGVQIPGSKASSSAFDKAATGQIGEDSDAKTQLSQLGIRVAKSKASNRRPQSPKEIKFTPPPLPEVGGPAGKRRTPQGAREMAEQALRTAQAPTQQDARQHAGRSSDPAKLKMDMEAASRALENAMQKKLNMAKALHSNEL